MRNKIIPAAEAVDMIPDGTIIMYGGFLGCGSAHHTIEALAQKGTKNLTIIGNDYGMATGLSGEGFHDVARLVHSHQIRHIIATHVDMTPDMGTQGTMDKTLAVDLTPQDALAKVIRAGGADLGDVLTSTGVGTIVEGSPFCLDEQTIDSRDYLPMKPIRADSALVNGYLMDKFGNIWYKGTTHNFNIAMAIVADVVIVEADSAVEIGDTQPEDTMASGASVNHIVDGGNAQWRSLRSRALLPNVSPGS